MLFLGQDPDFFNIDLGISKGQDCAYGSGLSSFAHGQKRMVFFGQGTSPSSTLKPGVRELGAGEINA
jgi:hypothetical protein